MSMGKEPQCPTRKWYFSIKEIEVYSPSRMDGIDHEEESRLRKLFCSFLQALGIELKVPQATIATAIMLCHRFFMRQSHAKNDWQTIATASMFLACKAEETPRWLSDVTVVAYKFINKLDPSALERIKQRDVYEKQKELILTGERLVLHTIAFDLNIEHPYKPLVAALKRLEISQKELAKVAWNFVNDWLQTTLCLEYKPHYIAAGSMFLAAKFQKVKLPTEQGKVWWMQFDVLPKLLEEVVQRMLGLLENNRKQTLPSTGAKVTKLKHEVTKAVPNVPKLGTVNSANAAQVNGHGDKIDGEALNKSSLSNTLQSCIINGSRATMESDAHKSSVSNSPRSCIMNGSVATMDARGLDKSDTSDSSQSCIMDGPDCLSSVPKFCENDISSDCNVSMKESSFYQTSDCESATRESRAGESGQSSDSMVVHVQLGENKLDVNRIKEALKRGIRDRIERKKMQEAADDVIDSEAWIEKELENGLELEFASAHKRHRF